MATLCGLHERVSNGKAASAIELKHPYKVIIDTQIRKCQTSYVTPKLMLGYGLSCYKQPLLAASKVTTLWRDRYGYVLMNE